MESPNTNRLVVCNGCGQARREVREFRARGPVLPADTDVVVVDPHDCPRTFAAGAVPSSDSEETT